MSTHRHHVLELPTPLMWEGHVDNFIVFLRSQGLVATSIHTKRNHVLQLARAFPDIPPTELDPGSLVEWCGTRAWANETRHAYYSTFRRFFGWLDSRHHCGNISSVLPRIRRPSGTPRPIPDSILVDCVDHASPRDALILRLAAEAGLRCVEIAQVEVGDVYEGADGWDLFVRGKGGRTRTVPITADLAQAIITRCTTTGQYAFPGRCGGHMAANSVSQIGRRVLPGTWTLHKLRHRYATKAYSAEHDLLIVRELLGHASLQTTVRYIAPSPRSRDAVLDATRVQSPASPNNPILPAPPA